MLVLDVSASYNELGDSFDGHHGNLAAGDIPDDNATDILLVEGTQYDDTIRLSEPDVALTGSSDAPWNGQLSGTAQFTLSLTAADDSEYSDTLTIAADLGNESIDDLVDDIESAIGASALNGTLTVRRFGNRISIATTGQGRSSVLTVTGVNEVARTELGLSESQTGVGLLSIDYTNSQHTHNDLVAVWRNVSGTPLVEQFRVSGLMGDDTLEFAAGADAVDMSAFDRPRRRLGRCPRRRVGRRHATWLGSP